jgi:maltokinase
VTPVVTDVRALLEQLCRDDPGALLPQRRRAAVPAEVLAASWRLLDVAALDAPGAAAADGHRVALLLDPSGGQWLVPVVARAGEVRRAGPGDGASEALVGALRAGGTVDGRLRVQALHAEPADGERALEVDQTNESVVVGERAVVKWYERASDQHPAPARVTALAQGGFTAMPRPWGFVWWDLDGRSVLVAAVADLLDDATDGWTWCVEDCRAWVRTRSGAADAWHPMRRLGGIVADLHVTLSAGSDVRASTSDVAAWHEHALRDLERALLLVDGPEGERLAARVPAVRAALDGIGRVRSARVVPVHGDLHVGQLLKHRGVAGWDYALTDFDGNPVLDAEQRSALQPAARDVAGMLQSVDHVGRVVVHRTEGVDPGAVRAWVTQAQAAFLDAYREGLAGRPGTHDLLEERLLLPFAVEQECRELIYAATHLPHWRYVPDAALADLVSSPDEGPR